MSKQSLTEGVDYYIEEVDGLKYRVFTEHYHSKRGFCCKNNCRHCPYGFNKKKAMKKSSLEEFKSLVESHYLSLSRYIVSSNEKVVSLEDYENYAWGKNPDLSVLFEKPCPLPISKVEVVYKERDCVFLIDLHLK
jgi:hypothetical protein